MTCVPGGHILPGNLSLRDYDSFTHKLFMELEKLAMLIAEEFVSVLSGAFDQFMEAEPDEETAPKVMIAGK
jgi:hypothetical protein